MKTYYNGGNSDLYSPRLNKSNYPIYRSTYDTQINYTPTTQYRSVRNYDFSDFRSTLPKRFSTIITSNDLTTSSSTSSYARNKPQVQSYNPSYSSATSPKTFAPSYLGTGRLSYQHLLNQIAQITDQLFLSSMNAITAERMRELGVTMIVSLITEPAPLRMSTIENVMVPIEDNEYANLKSYFDRIIDKMHKEEVKGGKILVHCVAGVSRSASLILAYLMKYHAMRLRQAYNHVRNRRPYIQPNIGFWKQLIDYEKRLFGTASVKLMPSASDKNILIPDVPPSQLSSVIGPRSSTTRVTTRYNY